MVEISPEQQEELRKKMENMSPEELKEFQKKNCIFCQIISGKVPSNQVYGDEKCLAILDINPAGKGHILLLPKEHYAVMPQVPEEEITHLFTVAKYLSQAQLKAFQAQGTNIFVANGLAAGQRAQHFMVHIVPRFEGDGLKSFDIPQKEASEQDLEKLKQVLIPKINKVFGLKKETIIEKKIQEKKPEPKKEKAPVPEKKEPPKKKEKKPEKKPKKKPAKKEESSLDDIAELFK